MPDGGTKLTVVASDGKLSAERIYELVYDKPLEFAGGTRLYLDPDDVGIGSPVSISGVSVEDRDRGDTVSYRLADDAPKDLSIDEATGEITYKGRLSGLPDGVKLTVVASDGKLSAERVYEITYDQRPEFEGGGRLYLDPDEVGTGSPVSISGIAAHDQEFEGGEQALPGPGMRLEQGALFQSAGLPLMTRMMGIRYRTVWSVRPKVSALMRGRAG